MNYKNINFTSGVILMFLLAVCHAMGETQHGDDPHPHGYRAVASSYILHETEGASFVCARSV